MGERKVINKYYPPDFDPAELEKHKKPKLKSGGKRRMVDVRMMLPMSVRCQACGEYMYKGKKFNSQKETVEGEDYCGIKVYRIYFKCVRCKTTFTIKTDPKNADYVCELNVTRNMEPRKDELKEMEHEKEERQKEEETDIMLKLENQSKDTKRELMGIQTVEELKLIHKRNEEITPEMLIRKKQEQQRQEKEINNTNFIQPLNTKLIRSKKTVTNNKKPKKTLSFLD